MGCCESVYVIADLEGVAGVDDWDPRHNWYADEARGVQELWEMRRLLTGEVNAAAEGLIAAGVREILIYDAHDAGRTILPERLIVGVQVVRGLARPCTLPGLTPRFQAILHVGAHAMAGTPGACLAHSGARGYRVRLNGREVGELELAAWQAGEMGVPWIFVSGDLHACREARRAQPGMVTAAVKEGLSTLCAIHLSPVDARRRIRERVQQAIAQAGTLQPLVVEGPVELQIYRDEPWPPGAKPDGERLDEHTIRFSGSSVWSVANRAFLDKKNVPLPPA